jgi:hypothetical protein
VRQTAKVRESWPGEVANGTFGKVRDPLPLDDLRVMADSKDWQDRVRAAIEIAPVHGAMAEPIVVRLLGDAANTAVSDAMAHALLEQQRENGVLPILRVLGSPIAVRQTDTAHHLSMQLLEAWAGDVDVGAVLDRILAQSVSAPELIGALEFVEWASPDHPPERQTVSLIESLAQSLDPRVAAAASDALQALGDV